MRAQLRDQLGPMPRDGLGADDDGQAIVRAAVRATAQLGQIVDMDRLEVQKMQQRLEARRLQI